MHGEGWRGSVNIQSIGASLIGNIAGGVDCFGADVVCVVDFRVDGKGSAGGKSSVIGVSSVTDCVSAQAVVVGGDIRIGIRYGDGNVVALSRTNSHIVSESD